MTTPLLSVCYFGSVEHYRILAQHPKVIIDLGEHYERQSYRNRTTIIGPNGTNDLVVPITRKSGVKMPMLEVGLSYAERWPQQHLHAIKSAYGKTPWYEHFVDDIESVLLEKYDRLVDLDLATMRLGLKWLGLKTDVALSKVYEEVLANRLDLRTTLHPKKPLPTGVQQLPAYTQVFADRHGFVGRLSVIDLVCNCGPVARSALLKPSIC